MIKRFRHRLTQFNHNSTKWHHIYFKNDRIVDTSGVQDSWGRDAHGALLPHAAICRATYASGQPGWKTLTAKETGVRLSARNNLSTGSTDEILLEFLLCFVSQVWSTQNKDSLDLCLQSNHQRVNWAHLHDSVFILKRRRFSLPFTRQWSENNAFWK